MYSWGTNSMGQCGQGSSSSSITTPGMVKGLEGVQVQQISAGTSHSVVWTAVPMDRYIYVHVIVVCTMDSPDCSYNFHSSKSSANNYRSFPLKCTCRCIHVTYTSSYMYMYM